MEEMMNEEWQTTGVCSRCRREKYCSKVCTAHKRNTQAFLRRAVLEKTGLGQIYHMMEEKMEEVRAADEERRWMRDVCSNDKHH